MALERIKQLGSHLTGKPAGVAALERKSPDDVVITMAFRSPLCKAKKGGFRDTKWVSLPSSVSQQLIFVDRTDELMLETFRVSIAFDEWRDASFIMHFQNVIKHSKVPPALVGDICVGTVLTPDSVYQARSAALAAGFPESVPVQSINRFCSSGLMALTTISNQIRAGQIDIGLAVGVESMSSKLVSLC